MPQSIVVQPIPLDKLIASKQVRERFDEESLNGLAQSIRETGQQEPVHVVAAGDGMYRVLTGERRIRAAGQVGETTILAIVEQGLLNQGQILLRQLTENIQRVDLTPIEKAKAIDALMMETGWNVSQAGSKLGLTNGTVSKFLSFLSLSEDLQQRIDAGELPASAAYELTKEDDPERREKLAGQVARGELTRDELSSAIKASKQRRYSPRKPRPKRVTAKLDGCETVSVSAPALNLHSFVLIVEKLLAHAKQAQTDGLTLDALLKRLAGQRAAAVASTEAA